MPSATTVPHAEIPVPSGQGQCRLESDDAQLVLCDHAKTCDSILYGDGRIYPEYFNPRLLEALRTIHQEFEGVYC
jgi:hypothetical protein